MVEPILAKADIKGCRRLENKNILVTAGTLGMYLLFFIFLCWISCVFVGIGRAIVERCLQEGANVFLCSRKQNNVDDATNNLQKKYNTRKVEGCSCNVGSEAQLNVYLRKGYEFFAQCQDKNVNKIVIDGLVSNAGTNLYFGMTYDADETAYQKIMLINVESYWKLVKLAKPRFTDGTSVVFISSVSGVVPTPPLGIYSVSKTALNSLARVLSIELGSEGVRVNVVAPGLIKTKMSERLWKGADGKEVTPPNRTSIARIGEPVDVAGPVAFLLSDDSAYLTGETIVVSGGVSSRL